MPGAPGMVVVALKSGGKADGRRDGHHRVGAEKYQGTGDPRHRLRPFLVAEPGPCRTHDDVALEQQRADAGGFDGFGLAGVRAEGAPAVLEKTQSATRPVLTPIPVASRAAGGRVQARKAQSSWKTATEAKKSPEGSHSRQCRGHRQVNRRRADGRDGGGAGGHPAVSVGEP